MVEGPTLYELPYFVSSKIFVTRVFLRLRNHTFNGYISGLEQDGDNLKQLLPTKSHIPYRLVPLPSRSRDHTTSGLAFLAFRSHKKSQKRGLCEVHGRGTGPRSWVEGGPVLGVTALPASTPITQSVEEYPTE